MTLAKSDTVTLDTSTIGPSGVCPKPTDSLVIKGRVAVASNVDHMTIVCREILFNDGAFIETGVALNLSATGLLAGHVDIRRTPPKAQSASRRREQPAAQDGADGRDGREGAAGSPCGQLFSGRKSAPGEPGRSGGPGAPGHRGRSGLAGHGGSKAPDIGIFAGDFAPDTTLSIQTRGEDGEPGQPGEAGQPGGDGGAGGRGGRGGAGDVCFRPALGGAGAAGGNGAAGGRGGNGGNGGNGGAGGNVTIVVDKAATSAWSDIQIDNRGGRPGSAGPGGAAGAGGSGGRGGPGGAGGAGNFLRPTGSGFLAVRDGAGGKSGAAGAPGVAGSAGRSGKPGGNGPLGRAVWRIFE